ncbi:MAG: transposase, partial [Bdellovibrionia bacterium]
PPDVRTWIKSLSLENVEDSIATEPDWIRTSDTGFHRFLGVINHRKTVLLFDTGRFKAIVLKRQKKIEDFRAWVTKHNEWLACFKKDAVHSAIEKDVQVEIKKHGLENFVEFTLHQYVTDNVIFQRRKNNPYPSQGYYRKIKSFQVVITMESSQSTLDGIFALISSRKSEITPEQMILAYREKYKIESAFREMKSILKLRPWFVYKEEHVRAHYTICVLAYLLERLMDLDLENSDAKNDGWSLTQFKEELQKIRLTEIHTGSTRTPVRKILQNVSPEIQNLLNQLGLKLALKPTV